MRILLAGLHRCGSTWVVNVLRRSGGIHCVYEPDEPGTDILGTVSADRLGRYPVLSPGMPSAHYATVWDVAFRGGWPWRPSPTLRRLGRVVRCVPPRPRSWALTAVSRSAAMRPLRADHVLVKSANCAFSVEWIVERYKPSVLLQYRDPLNVVSSWLVHHIAPDVPVDHPAVRERIWGPQGVDTLPAPTSHVGRVALAVGCLTLALKVTADRHPDWTVISYDQLCEQPEAGFKRLFNHLALQWTDDVATYLDTADAPGFVDPHRNPRQLDDVSPEAWAREGRRAGQGTAFQRRMKPADVAEARAVLSELPLGEWAAAEEHEPDPR